MGRGRTGMTPERYAAWIAALSIARRADWARNYEKRRMAIRNALEDPLRIALRRAKRTHCKYGHAFEPDNFEWQASGRRCLMCKRAWGRKYMKRAYDERKLQCPSS